MRGVEAPPWIRAVAYRESCLTGAIGKLSCSLCRPAQGVSEDATPLERRAERGSANAAPHSAPTIEQHAREDGTAMSPHVRSDIGVHHRVPAPHVLRELDRVLELHYDAILALAGAVDTVVREYLEAHPQHTEAV